MNNGTDLLAVLDETAMGIGTYITEFQYWRHPACYAALHKTKLIITRFLNFFTTVFKAIFVVGGRDNLVSLTYVARYTTHLDGVKLIVRMGPSHKTLR